MANIKLLFLDIGGVLLTNGWDRENRERAIETFHLEREEFNLLHHQYYNLHEQGKMTLSDYLDKVVFWKKRDFSKAEFETFMKDQSKSLPEMMDYFLGLKKKYSLKMASLSNEGRELTEYRVKTFDLCKLFDFFIVSCFVGYQKPDPRIYKTAIDISQVPLNEILYIDDRHELIEAASKIGLKGITHTSLESTKAKLEELL